MRRRALLAGALAALAACEETKGPPVEPRSALADSADQVMFKARSLLTDRGVLRAELLADTAYFFDESTRIEMRDVTTTFFTATGAKNAVLTSREGTYSTRANNMEARGNVVVVTEDGRRLSTPQLRYEQGRDQISSDSAFVLTEPGRKLTGVGFTSDPNMTQMRCLAACRGEAGEIQLPGQRSPSAAPSAPRPVPQTDSLLRLPGREPPR